MATEYSIPKLMKAAQISKFGDTSEVLTVSTNVETPSFPPRKDHVIIKVYACSLSPSDYRMSSGDGDLVKKPKSWPYIPGGDVSGIIVSINENETKFKVGDYVIGTWDVFGIGGIAEYTLVHTKYVEKYTNYMLNLKNRFIIGAALVDSSVNSLLASEDSLLKSSDKLLLLGGSGSVGTTLIQIATNIIGIPNNNIVTTSSDLNLIQNKLNIKNCINYKNENWYENDLINKLKPFDVVIDCAEGELAWNNILKYNILKSNKNGGRFLAVVVNQWHIEVHNPWQLISFLLKPLRRSISGCWYSNTLPSYKMLFPAPRGNSLQRFLNIFDQGKIDIIIDENGPHDFTTEGVRQAFDIMVKRKGHGKVVIKIRDEDQAETEN